VRYDAPPPRLGQDTQDVLGELAPKD